MSYFHNCQFGINAQNKADINIFKPSVFTNVSSSALNVEGNSNLYAIGASATTGPSGHSGNSIFSFNCNAVINAKNSVIRGDNLGLYESKYGIILNNCEFAVENSYISRGYIPVDSYGILADNFSNGTVFGTSITGYPSLTGATSTTGGALFAAMNGSTIVAGNDTQRNQINTVQGNFAGNAAVGTVNARVDYAGIIRRRNDDGWPPLDY